MASIRDIAKRAGVSVTTVSHVINKSRVVHPDTIARVMKAIDELGYKPNMLARSLRLRKTHTIGLLISDIEGPYFAELVKAVETTAYERGFSTILCNTDEKVEKETAYLDVLLSKQVDGLVLAPSPGDHTFLTSYLKNGAHIVCVNRYLPDACCPAVVGNDEQAMCWLADKLISSGHRKIGILLGLENISTTRDRLNGVQSALTAHGLSLDDVWIIPGYSRRDGGHQAVEKFLALPDRPTGILFFNTLMHEGFLTGLSESAPELIRQIDMFSFGHSQVAALAQPNYWCVVQPACEIGKTAANLLIDSLTNNQVLEQKTIVIENQLLGPKALISPLALL